MREEVSGVFVSASGVCVRACVRASMCECKWNMCLSTCECE